MSKKFNFPSPSASCNCFNCIFEVFCLSKASENNAYVKSCDNEKVLVQN